MSQRLTAVSDRRAVGTILVAQATGQGPTTTVILFKYNGYSRRSSMQQEVVLAMLGSEVIAWRPAAAAKLNRGAGGTRRSHERRASITSTLKPGERSGQLTAEPASDPESAGPARSMPLTAAGQSRLTEWLSEVYLAEAGPSGVPSQADRSRQRTGSDPIDIVDAQRRELLRRWVTSSAPRWTNRRAQPPGSFSRESALRLQADLSLKLEVRRECTGLTQGANDERKGRGTRSAGPGADQSSTGKARAWSCGVDGVDLDVAAGETLAVDGTQWAAESRRRSTCLAAWSRPYARGGQNG